MYVDLNARQKNAPENLVLKAFYGQLEDILVVRVPNPDLGKLLQFEGPSHQIAVLGSIRTCVHPKSDPLAPLKTAFNVKFYSSLGALDYIGISSVKSLVGRIKYKNGWAIIDRTGELVLSDIM